MMICTTCQNEFYPSGDNHIAGRPYCPECIDGAADTYSEQLISAGRFPREAFRDDNHPHFWQAMSVLEWGEERE